MIIKYKKIKEVFDIRHSTTHTLREPDYKENDLRCTELCTIDGYTYVHVPDTVTLPDQSDKILVESVTLTDELKSEIKAFVPMYSYHMLDYRNESGINIVLMMRHTSHALVSGHCPGHTQCKTTSQR